MVKKALYKLLCLLGHHEWYVHKKEQVFDWANGPAQLFGLMIGVSALVSLLCFLIGYEEGNSQTVTTAFYALGFIFVGGWLLSFSHSCSYRKDAQCLRCATLKTEVSKREKTLAATKTLFKEMDGVN